MIGEWKHTKKLIFYQEFNLGTYSILVKNTLS